MSFDQDTFNSGEVSVGDYFGARSCNVGKLTSNKQNPNERVSVYSTCTCTCLYIRTCRLSSKHSLW